KPGDRKMRLAWRSSVLGLFAILAFGLLAAAQNGQPAQSAQTGQAKPAGGGGEANTLYNRLNIGPGGPAPKRDLTGSWTGPLDARIGTVPPMTPYGQKMFAANKPENK